MEFVSPTELALVSYLGPLVPKFTGRWSLNSSTDRHHTIKFAFKKATVTFGGKQLAEFPMSMNEKAYGFFYVAPDIALVRSSGGNVSLLKRA